MLRLVELAECAVEQQLRAFPNTRQRCLEFVRHVAQEAIFFLCQLEQAYPQPFELATQSFQIRRALDGDRFREPALAQLRNGFVDLADRLGDEQRKEHHENQRARNQRGNLPRRDLLRLARAFLQMNAVPRRRK